ncbi:MAG TPA: PGPGW domain-containing protein [Pseudonocardiaceae bacterium]|nr:PGPGW domain-containing protein [Pseudonocardiaceae bacterium]
MTAPTTELTTTEVTERPSRVKRIGRIVGGWSLLAVGGAMLVLPGPGLLVIAGGLALLATEYTWAARLLANVKQRLARLRPRRDDPHRDEEGSQP